MTTDLPALPVRSLHDAPRPGSTSALLSRNLPRGQPVRATLRFRAGR